MVCFGKENFISYTEGKWGDWGMLTDAREQVVSENS